MKQPTPKIKTGETWFIKLPGASALTKAIIHEVTKLVVEIQTSEYSDMTNFYTKAELTFVERVATANPQVNDSTKGD